MTETGNCLKIASREFLIAFPRDKGHQPWKRIYPERRGSSERERCGRGRRWNKKNGIERARRVRGNVKKWQTALSSFEVGTKATSSSCSSSSCFSSTVSSTKLSSREWERKTERMGVSERGRGEVPRYVEGSLRDKPLWLLARMKNHKPLTLFRGREHEGPLFPSRPRSPNRVDNTREPRALPAPSLVTLVHLGSLCPLIRFLFSAAPQHRASEWCSRLIDHLSWIDRNGERSLWCHLSTDAYEVSIW